MFASIRFAMQFSVTVSIAMATAQAEDVFSVQKNYNTYAHPNRYTSWSVASFEIRKQLLKDERTYKLPYKYFAYGLDSLSSGQPSEAYMRLTSSVAATRIDDLSNRFRAFSLFLDQDGSAMEFFMIHLGEMREPSWFCGRDCAPYYMADFVSLSYGVITPHMKRHLQSWSTPRNLIAVATLWRRIDSLPVAKTRAKAWLEARQRELRTPQEADVDPLVNNLLFIQKVWAAGRPFDRNESIVNYTDDVERRDSPSLEERHQIRDDSPEAWRRWLIYETLDSLITRGNDVRPQVERERASHYSLAGPSFDDFSGKLMGEIYVIDAANALEDLSRIKATYEKSPWKDSVISMSELPTLTDDLQKFQASFAIGLVGYVPGLEPISTIYDWLDAPSLQEKITHAFFNARSDTLFESIPARALARLGHQTIREREIDGEVISPVLKHMQKPATDDNLEWVGKVIDYIDSNQMAKFRTELWIKEREKLIAEKPEKIIPEKRFFRGKEGGWIYRGFHFAIKNTDAFSYTNEQDRTENENISTMINALDEPTQKEWLARMSGKPVEGASGKLPPEIEGLLPKQAPEDDLVLKQLRKLREFLDKNKMVDIAER